MKQIKKKMKKLIIKKKEIYLNLIKKKMKMKKKMKKKKKKQKKKVKNLYQNLKI